MFAENPFSGTCEYALYEVLVMLLGSVLLGLILGYLIWGWLKHHVARLEQEALRHQRIASRRQLQVASMITRVKSVEYALQYATTKTSLAEFRLKKAIEEIETLKEAPVQKDPLQYTADWGEDEPTLAGLTEIMSKGKSVSAPLQEAEIVERESEPVAETTDGASDDPEENKAVHLHEDSEVFHDVSAGELTEILGINAEIALLLEKAGIYSWNNLASADADFLRSILDTAGSAYTNIDPSSWPVQARMASRSEWKKLRVYQEALKQK